MTTLALADERPGISVRRLSGGMALRAWLAGRWAILFSHPEDFAQEQLELDRWISILSEGFRGRGVAAVALRRADREPEMGWLERLAALSGDCAATSSLQPAQPAAPADFAASTLHADIARGGPRFALIIDSELRCRRTLRYQPPVELPSPLDLVGWAVAQRKRESIALRRPGESEPLSPFRSGWSRLAYFGVAQAGRGG
jgi:thioredoxin-dependent peroxiredoxin